MSQRTNTVTDSGVCTIVETFTVSSTIDVGSNRSIWTKPDSFSTLILARTTGFSSSSCSFFFQPPLNVYHNFCQLTISLQTSRSSTDYYVLTIRRINAAITTDRQSFRTPSTTTYSRCDVGCLERGPVRLYSIPNEKRQQSPRRLLPQHHQVGGDSRSPVGLHPSVARIILVRLRRRQAATIT